MNIANNAAANMEPPLENSNFSLAAGVNPCANRFARGFDMSSTINLHAMPKQAGYQARIVANPLKTGRGNVVLRSCSGQDVPNPSDDVPPDVSIEPSERIMERPQPYSR